MLENENIFVTICWNIILILAWDFIVFCLCKTLNEDQLDYKKYMYKIKYWEDKGSWYNKRLKIRAWKDFLPQYISKNGFSKKNLNSLSLNYINQFILETCRAEWAHKNCMWIAVLLVFINKFIMGIFFFIIVLIINLPYIFIQRYNRIRLINLKEKILKLNKSKFQNEETMNFAHKKFNA